MNEITLMTRFTDIGPERQRYFFNLGYQEEEKKVGRWQDSFSFVSFSSFWSRLKLTSSNEKNNPRGREKGQPVLIVIITVC